MPKPQLILPPRQNITPTGDWDPLPLYYRPFVGWLYRRRLNIGLGLLEQRKYSRVLEVGYGSGVLLTTLSTISGELHAIDSHEHKSMVQAMMERQQICATLAQGDIQQLDYPDNWFDLVLCFSTLEHVSDTDQAVGELARVLKPGGTALIGFPSVSWVMDFSFPLIGIHGIEHHHISDHNQIHASCRKMLQLVRTRKLIPCLPMGLALYNVCLCRKNPD